MIGIRGLAVRIFLSYWVIHATLLASFALLPDEGPASAFTYLLEQHGRAALGIYQEFGASACGNYLSTLRSRAGIALSVVSPNGEVLCGDASEPTGDDGGSGMRFRAEQVQVALADRGASVTVVGHAVSGVYRRPSPPFPLMPLGLTVLVSGLFCYLVAQWLTRPLSRVRDASHRLAAGDLEARVGPTGSDRSDEIGDLVRDFDVMASRIEGLVDAQGQILSDISHELRSPLARLGVALELARRRASAEAVPHLDRIELEAALMNELIGRVLLLSRAEMAPPVLIMFDLAAVIQKVVADASYEAERQHKHVTLSLETRLTLLGDPALVASAIDNVVRNAVRHTLESTAVSVSASCADRQLAIVVHDRGPGVPVAELERIFMPFHRVEFARNRETGGVGLGLAIAKRAVHVHGGSITAANHPAGGLVVTIQFPLADEPLQNNSHS